MKLLKSLGVLIVICAAALGARGAIQCCAPPYQDEPQNIQWRIVADSDFPISVYNTLVQGAADKWNAQLAANNQGVQISPGSNGLRIIFTSAIQDPGAVYDPNQNAIFLPKEYHTKTDPPFSGEYIEAVILHEFGHPLGWGQASCAGSVMSDTTLSSYRTTFSNCDETTFENHWSGDACDVNPNSQECCAITPGGYWDGTNCIPFTPLMVVFGGESSLSTVGGGVLFALVANGPKMQISWTRPDSDIAWVVLDRNGNGSIDDATELFSSTAPQPPSDSPNGFEALRMFDSTSDGWIDSDDAVYRSLRLWTDRNHDGISQGTELKSLRASGIARMSLDYRPTRRVDRADNEWKYRARIVGDGSPSLWDVILQIKK